MIALGLVAMALAGAVIAAYALLVAFGGGDDEQTSVGLIDHEPTARHCGPGCTCRGSASW